MQQSTASRAAIARREPASLIAKTQPPVQFAVLGIHDYFDRITIWLKRPLSRNAQARLQAECPPNPVTGSPTLTVTASTAWWDWGYRQKLEIWQPSTRAKQLLAQLDDDVLMNYVEITRDFVFADQFELERVLEFIADHHLQPWHRSENQVHGYANGFTTRTPPQPGERRDGHWVQGYAADYCKVTGETPCLRYESKRQGGRFLRRLGLSHPRDLINFDFAAYFAKWMRFYQIDLDRLGRWHDNRITGRRRQRPHVELHGPLTFDFDGRCGDLLYRVYAVHPTQQCPHLFTSRSLQQFVHSYGRGPFIVRIPSPLYTYIHIAHTILFGQHHDLVGETCQITPQNPVSPLPALQPAITSLPTSQQPRPESFP